MRLFGSLVLLFLSLSPVFCHGVMSNHCVVADIGPPKVLGGRYQASQSCNEMKIIMENKTKKIVPTTYHGRKQLISVSGFSDGEASSSYCGQAGVVCLLPGSGYRQAGKISIDVCHVEPVKLFI